MNGPLICRVGDCVLYQDGSKYNLCVLAERRCASGFMFIVMVCQSIVPCPEHSLSGVR